MSKTIKVVPVDNGYILTIDDERYSPGIFCYKEAANKQALSDAEYLKCEVVLIN